MTDARHRDHAPYRDLAKIEILDVAARPHIRSAKSFMLRMELECRHNPTNETKRRGLRMVVKYLTAKQRLAFGDQEQAKAGFYWQAEVDDPWIGPFETLEEASTDGKQSCFGLN